MDASLQPLDKLYTSAVVLIIANVIVSLFLVLKADWLATRLTRTDKDISVELTPLSLTKVLLMTVGTIWLAGSIYDMPDFIGALGTASSDQSGQVDTDTSVFPWGKYLLKTIISLVLIFKASALANLLTRKI
ncbi:MAG: hypothetical protein WBB45_11550 [Cyclobacteriaceae bacterium]